MSKFKNWVRNLSLAQQLFVIVVFVMSFLFVFFFGVLSVSVDEFVKSQMSYMLHHAQDTVIENYKMGLGKENVFGVRDDSITHIIQKKDGTLWFSSDDAMEEIDTTLLQQLVIQMNAIELYDRINYTSGTQNLIAIQNIDKEATIASIMSIQYQNNFKRALLNSFVYLIMVTMSVLFVLLVLWMSTIIHPLNQIKDYIEKIKQQKKATLRIDRGDEIGAVANALVEMNEEIQRQQAQKEEMLQNISHDLKTPVATIKSYSEAIKDGIYPYETLEKSVDVILEHANRLEKKVYNLLMLNRMDYMTNEQIKSNEKLHLAPIVEQVIVSSKQIRPEIDLKLELKGDDLFVGQEEPWRVVIENLLDNALRYSETCIVITINSDELRVYNDGKGVDPNRIQQLFKPYEKGEQGQFGLGLAIVYRVVTNYGYSISVQNEDRGVCFTIKRKEGKK